MSILAGKLLTPLISPLGVALLLWVAGACWSWCGRPDLGRRLRLAGGLVLLVLGCPLVGERLLHRLEAQYPLVPVAASPQAEAIVVLGGFTKPPIPPRLTTEVDEGFDRLLHGMRLWRAGKAPLLVLSGGNIPYLTGTAMTEAASLCSLAVEYGVPPEAILLEGESRNTYENALFTGRLLRERGLSRILLVTSASHMPRSAAVFRRQGLEVLPAPADLQVVPRPLTLIQFLPAMEALSFSTTAIKEQVGIGIYWLRDWL